MHSIEHRGRKLLEINIKLAILTDLWLFLNISIWGGGQIKLHTNARYQSKQ